MMNNKIKINKKELLSALKKDLQAASTFREDEDIKIAKRVSEYQGKPYGNEQKGKSAIVSLDIKRQSEWAHAALVDPFVGTTDVIKCTPVTWEDREAARQNELLLNTQFCRQFDRYNFMTTAIKVLDIEATCVVQTGWEYDDEKIEVEREIVEVDALTGEEYIIIEKIEETKVLTNRPTAIVRRNEDVYVDPTCMGDHDKMQFVIVRYETDLSTLRQDGRYKNLDTIQVGSEDANSHDDYETKYGKISSFTFEDNPRKKMVMYEYWGNYDINDDGIAEPIVCAWVGSTVIRLELNPYPDKKPPFIIVPFNKIPFEIYGESNADLISDNQKIKTAITRGIIDNMNQSNNGMIGIKKGSLDPGNREKFMKGKPFEFNGSPSDFWQGSFNNIPGSAFDMLALMNNEIESITGIKSFSGGITGSSLGNMLDITTDIPMIDGSFKKLADIVDGDVLIGSNGEGTTVLKAHDIKLPKVAYDMVFGNGSVVKSGGEHLWTVKVEGGSHKLREWTTMDADEVYKYVSLGKRVVVPAIKEVRSGTPTGNSIDPYVLGFWLGDGMSHSARITTADLEIVTFFNEAGYDCVEVKDSSKTGKAKMYDVYKTGHLPQRDPKTGQYISTGSLHSELRDLGVFARYGGEKHIPEEYFTATYDEKLELIRGLMDSDGFAHSGAFVQFAQGECRLKNDFIRLIESIGLKASVIRRDKNVRNKQKLDLHARTDCKLILATKDSYEIGFTPWSNPFKLTRKATKWKLPRRQTVAISSMTIVDKVPMRCLTVDSEDKLFAVTDKYTLTHNTATGARGALDATSTRRLNIVRNIAENLVKPLMRKWMAYNAEFLEESEVVRITNEEFVEVRRDDLAGKIDIDITVSTQEDNAARAQELGFLLQTLGSSLPFDMTRMIMAEIAKLSKLPTLEKSILEYKQEPDPVQQKMQELQLAKLEAEIQRLKADAMHKIASSQENEADKEEKMAQAQLKRAQARKAESEADMVDLNFMKADEQIDEQNALEKELMKFEMEMERKQFDALHQLNIIDKQISHGSKNEQIGVGK